MKPHRAIEPIKPKAASYSYVGNKVTRGTNKKQYMEYMQRLKVLKRI